jgi:hypothetical protein
VAARTVPFNSHGLEEMAVQRLAVWRRVGVKTPLGVAGLRLEQLRTHLLNAQPATRCVRVDERDGRLPLGGCGDELAHAVLRLEVAL